VISENNAELITRHSLLITFYARYSCELLYANVHLYICKSGGISEGWRCYGIIMPQNGFVNSIRKGVKNMYEACGNCGKRIPDADIDIDGPYIVCYHCGFKLPFRMLPLFIIMGVSGTGKTTLCVKIAAMDEKPDLVYLNSDMLLMKGLADSGWDKYRNTWLWVCFNIAQSGRPVALFGSAMPSDFIEIYLCLC
jgi:DNA-directed RNA polymerase subunit RPC12/RpoP